VDLPVTWTHIGLALEIGLGVVFALVCLICGAALAVHLWDDVREQMAGVLQSVWELLTHNR
jgi:hypothetical protein